MLQVISVLMENKPGALLRVTGLLSARVIDSSVEGLAIEATGDPEKLDEFVDVMRSYGNIGVTRSGVVAVSLEAKKLKLQPPVPTKAANLEPTNGVVNG